MKDIFLQGSIWFIDPFGKLAENVIGNVKLILCIAILRISGWMPRDPTDIKLCLIYTLAWCRLAKDCYEIDSIFTKVYEAIWHYLPPSVYQNTLEMDCQLCIVARLLTYGTIINAC